MRLFLAALASLLLPALSFSESVEMAVDLGDTCGISALNNFDKTFKGRYRIAGSGCKIGDEFNAYCSFERVGNSLDYTWQKPVEFGPKNGKTCPDQPNNAPVDYNFQGTRPSCNQAQHPTGQSSDPPCPYNTCASSGGTTALCACLNEADYPNLTGNEVKWYCLYSSCQCPSTSSGGGGGTNNGRGGCFSADTEVQVQDQGIMRMDELKVGDFVKTSSGKYERVYGFGHRSESHQEEEYLQIHADGIKPLTLSAYHVVFVKGNKAVPAVALKPGDKLMTESGDTAIVQKTKSVRGKGAYAPFTESGKIIANGIVASNYIAFFKSGNLEIGGWELPLSVITMTHRCLAPLRLMCKLNWNWCQNATYDEDGVPTYLAKPFKMTKWYLKQSPIAMVTLLVLLLGFILLVGSLEFVIMNTAWMVLAAAVWRWNMKNKHSSSSAAGEKTKKI